MFMIITDTSEINMTSLTMINEEFLYVTLKHVNFPQKMLQFMFNSHEGAQYRHKTTEKCCALLFCLVRSLFVFQDA